MRSEIQKTAADGTMVRLNDISKVSSVVELLKREKEHMAAAFRIFAKMGFADGASGHISLRDPTDLKTFWINPYAVHFGAINVSDLMHVDEDGNCLSETSHKVNTAGFVIHSEIHKARPNINAACHCHSPYGRAWSTFGKPLEMLNQDSCMFYDSLAVYQGFGSPVLAADEGRRVVHALGPTKKNITLQNHGVLTTRGTVAKAAAFFIALERAYHTQLVTDAAAASGLQKRYVSNEAAKYTSKTTSNSEVMYAQF
ncbi:hypothetical protein V499_01096 [Pseudogymnoascus sp. VKM F-103]|nr:hypothetical protein V499_01096 [Pseudogymnoascus sp. VKM F-103]